MRKAVIDVGSNSVILTVEERTESGWNPICETTDVTSLGEGTKESGILSEAGMQRTLRALTHAYNLAKQSGCRSIVAGATMAARIASNTPVFLAQAAAQETPVIVLSGDQEAELGFLAVADDPAFSSSRLLSIIDVGGQSTELATAVNSGDGWTTLFRRSFPVGTLGLRGGVLSPPALGMLEMLQGVRQIDEAIGLDYLPDKAGQVVVLGATGTNLITIRGGMASWDPAAVHGQWLDYEEISKAAGWLGAMTDQERRAVKGMEVGRERTLHIGALILERFLFAIRASGCSVSVRGWRHALLENTLAFPDNGR